MGGDAIELPLLAAGACAAHGCNPGLRGTVPASWAAWLVLTCAFVLVTARRGRVWSWYTLDVGAMVVLSLLGAAYFRHAAWGELPLVEEVRFTVITAALVYLAARFARLVATDGYADPSVRPLLGVRALWLVAAVSVCAQLLAMTRSLHGLLPDVGMSGATGAELMLDGALVYGAGPFGLLPGFDTYGPLNYIAYVPAWLAIQATGGDPSYIDVARLTTAFATLACLAGVVVATRRAVGSQAAAFAAAAWATCPLVALATVISTNDTIIGGLLVWAVALAASPLRSALLVGTAVWVKFVPALVVPAFARLRSNPAGRATIGWWLLGLALPTALSAVYVGRYRNGFDSFWTATFHYQLHRDSDWSIWARLGVEPLASVAALAGALVLAAMFARPRSRSLVQLAAGVALAMVLAQVPLRLWWYAYPAWFAPVMALLLATACHERAGARGSATADAGKGAPDAAKDTGQ